MRTHALRRLAGLFSVAALALALTPPAAAQMFTTYHCDDGTEFIIALFDADRRAHVQLDGKALTLSRRLAANGARYVKDDVSLRLVKAGATLQRGRRATACSAD